ncbi:MAG TPA: mycofactocin biosynthesis glycosyltransferase MftF [Ktedonobacteraceae bacterium]|nr:mycofactocin biosynthesis glycosyltransferase MftF [Ktedonobacteraceae bacterium]
MRVYPPSLRSGCYCLARTVRIIPQENGGLALCSYPLRVLRLSTLTTHLLLHCCEQRTCEELAQLVDLPTRRVQTLCEQLRWKGLLETGPALPPATWPGVSIIIPTYNRAQQLERCLKSLLGQDYPAQCLELIVVDDASTDETATMLQQLAQQAATQGLAIQVIHHTSRQGVAKSRNTGAEAAHHDLLAYIDSDCVASPGWLTELVPALQDTHLGAVGGMIRAYERHNMLGRYEDVRSSLFMGTRAQQVRLEGPLTYLPTANLLIRRALLHKLGGFAPLNFGEDVDFCHRLLATGSQMVYLPQGIVYHDYRTTLRAFLSTRISYASSEAALLQRHPTQRRTLLLPPEQATFAALVIGGLWLSTISFGARRGPQRSLRSAFQYLVPTADLSAPTICQGARRGPQRSLRSVFQYFAPTAVAPRFIVGERSGARINTSAPGKSTIGKRTPTMLFLAALLLTFLGTSTRWRKVQQQTIPLNPLIIFQATLRGHLAYTYHLCRHLTRYYTLPLLAIGLLVPPFLPLVLILCSVVISVDYARLQPHMGLSEYILCSLLNDCAYEVGVVLGCIKYRTWRPLLPIIHIKRKHR